MENIALIIVICVLALILIVMGIILIFVLKNNSKNKDGNNFKNDLDEIKKTLTTSSLETKSAIKDELLHVSKGLNDQVLSNLKVQNDNFSQLKDDLIRKNTENNENLLKKVDSNFSLTNNKINDNFITLTKQVEDKMSSTDGKIKENLDKGFKDNIESLQKVNLTLGKISESQKNIDNLNTQIVKLNTVFSNNQIRGKFGEIQLEKILQAIFGEARNIYDFQYEMDLKDRKVRPDAVIHLDDEDKTILCIDSKFSFVSYGEIFDKNPKDQKDQDLKLIDLKSDLQNQIKKINKDYIVKDKTYIYALMFIPSDSIYNFIYLNDYLYENVIEYARKLNVILVSPSTIQPILANINILRINLNLSKNIKKVVEEIDKLSKASNTLNKKWTDFSTTFKTLVKRKGELDNPINNIYNKTKNVVETAIKKDVINESELSDSIDINKEFEFEEIDENEEE